MEDKFSLFIESVPEEHQQNILELHKLFTKYECHCDIKEAKSGYVVSYINQHNKKTLANIVFRKTGIKLRMYLEHIASYDSYLDELPSSMKQEVRKAGICKRLYDPTTCNQRCSMGYRFTMDHEEYKLCRNMAFMPTIQKETQPYIIKLLKLELEYRN